MSADSVLHLFEAYGIEIEYMIVDSETLDVRPITDELLRSIAGSYESEIELGDIAWSNELALHVLELKTNGPSATLRGLGENFQSHVVRANELLAQFDARLLPSGMHPWMDTASEFRLWPHEYNIVYETFDRIFGCAGHGWANVQSTHLNLPFGNDEEFGRLHAAIRLVMPLIPALAASTPVADGALNGSMDRRLEYYATNAARVPSVTGSVVPEPVFSMSEYLEHLLPRIYTDLEPYDPQGVLRHEWVNARGTIARFDRMALEIRIVDVQECPVADIAVASAISAAVRAHVEEAWCDSKRQRAWDHRELAAILLQAIKDGDDAVVDHTRFLGCFGYPERGRARLGDLWQHIVETSLVPNALTEGSRTALATILTRGCLARRITEALRDDSLPSVYARLADCLAKGESFEPAH